MFLHITSGFINIFVIRGLFAGQVENIGAYGKNFPTAEARGACAPGTPRQGVDRSCLLVAAASQTTAQIAT